MTKLEYLHGKKIMVTGGGGFLGSHVVKKLQELGISKKNIFVPRSKDFDLVEKENIVRMFKLFPPNVVIHTAGEIGGIGANVANPATFFYKNLIMGAQMMEVARINGVEKFVAIGTTCSYPKNAPQPLNEATLWDGYPAEETAPYGLAKKMLIVQSEAYRKQYNFNAINLIPTNLYGPNDHFDVKKSHVLPALIRRCVEMKEQGSATFEVWGSGSATRDFLYVEDAAEGIVLAAEKYNKSEPVNLGSCVEVSIKQLAEKVCSHIGFKGSIVWDKTKPDGVPRRCVDARRAEKEFGFKARTPLDIGLKKTVDWYMSQRA